MVDNNIDILKKNNIDIQPTGSQVSNSQPLTKETIPMVQKTSSGASGDNFTKSDDEISRKLEILLSYHNLSRNDLKVMLKELNVDVSGLTEEQKYDFLMKRFKLDETEFFARPDVKKLESQIDANKKVTTSDSENSETGVVNGFSHEDFSAKSTQEKLNTYFEELAKNQYLYSDSSNKKTEDDWAALPETEKQALINGISKKVTKALSKGKIEDSAQIKEIFGGLFCEDSIDMSLNMIMTRLQVANANNISIKEFSKLDKITQEEAIHEYILSLDKNALSENQKTYLKEMEDMSAAVKYIAEQQGESFGDGHIIMPPSEIKSRLKDLGTDGISAQIAYLEDKKAKGLISKDQTEKLNSLNDYKNGLAAVKDIPDKDYGRIAALKNSDYGKLFENCKSNKGKLKVAAEYIEHDLANLPPEEYAKAIQELTREFQGQEGYEEFSFQLYGIALKKASPEQRLQLSKSDNGRDQLSNAINIQEFGEDALAIQNITDSQKQLLKASPIAANTMAAITVDHATTAQLALDSMETYSKDEDGWSNEVQSKYGESAYRDGVTAEQQYNIASRTAKNSDIEVAKQVGLRTKDAYVENQARLDKEFFSRKEVAEYLNANATVDQYDKSAQQEVARNRRIRFEQDDFSKEEAVKNLNILADQIQNCDKDNQLAIHNDIMGSKYKEVQEHAAGNIGNYDPSVQSDALNTVYATGNQSAIDAAVESVANSSSVDAVEQVTPVVIAEASIRTIEANPQAFDNLEVISTGQTLRQKIASGARLTVQEYASLTSAEKRDYFVKFFKSLSPNEKVKLIKSISSDVQRRNIYKMIARTNNDMFDRLIQDASVAQTIYDMNISGEINYKIEQLANKKYLSNNAFADLASETEKNKKIDRTPLSGRKTFEFWKKSDDGILLG